LSVNRPLSYNPGSRKKRLNRASNPKKKNHEEKRTFKNLKERVSRPLVSSSTDKEGQAELEKMRV